MSSAKDDEARRTFRRRAYYLAAACAIAASLIASWLVDRHAEENIQIIPLLVVSLFLGVTTAIWFVRPQLNDELSLNVLLDLELGFNDDNPAGSLFWTRRAKEKSIQVFIHQDIAFEITQPESLTDFLTWIHHINSYSRRPIQVSPKIADAPANKDKGGYICRPWPFGWYDFIDGTMLFIAASTTMGIFWIAAEYVSSQITIRIPTPPFDTGIVMGGIGALIIVLLRYLYQKYLERNLRVEVDLQDHVILYTRVFHGLIMEPVPNHFDGQKDLDQLLERLLELQESSGRPIFMRGPILQSRGATARLIRPYLKGLSES